MTEKVDNGGSTGAKRSKAQRDIDFLYIQERTIQGYTCRMIAAALAEIRPYKISFQSVANDLKKLRAMWREKAVQRVDEVKGAALESLAWQRRELAEAWAKSKQDAVVKRAEKTTEAGGADQPAADGAKSKTSVTQEAQCGDPRFQGLFLDVVKEEAKIVGIYSPEQTVVMGPDGGAIHAVLDVPEKGSVSKPTADEVERMESGGPKQQQGELS